MHKVPLRTRAFATTMAVITAASMAIPNTALAQIQFNGDSEVHDTYASDTLNHDGQNTTMDGYDGVGFVVSGGEEQTIEVKGENNVEGTIASTTDLTITGGGTLNVETSGTGVGTYGSSEDSADLTIDNTTVNVSNADDANGAWGVAAQYGDINIQNGAEVNVDIDVPGRAEGVRTIGGDVNITDSTVNVKSKSEVDNASSRAMGIAAYGRGDKGGNINVDNSDVKVDSSIAMWAISTNGKVPGQINITNSKIVAPEGAHVQDVDYWIKSDIDGDGKIDDVRVYGQTIGKGDDVIASFDDPDILGTVEIKSARSLNAALLKKIPATSDNTANAAAIALGASALIVAGAVVSRRRMQE